MIVKQLTRFPFKGMMGEPLPCAQFEIGSGVVGDRRFAFGVDETMDDGVWRSSRSYLINAVNDNLLQFEVSSDPDGWLLRNHTGDVARVENDGFFNTQDIDALLDTNLGPLESKLTRPVLVDRKKSAKPKGHWDFTDSQLSIVNLATVRELELRWNIEIDARRFRANILIDGISPWSEFSFYGAKFGIGGAQIDILRPSRRCAATSVNPETGERDADLLQRLVRDYGHGFLGVYATVSSGGVVAVGDNFKPIETSFHGSTTEQCPLAPDVTLWPKAATVSHGKNASEFDLRPVGPLPIVAKNTSGRVKIHTGEGPPVVTEILSVANTTLLLKTDGSDRSRDTLERAVSPQDHVIVSGPFPIRSKTGK
ncbi:MAG: MOSC domain-containing protein [Pseudomonadota bacterium]